MKPEFFKIDFRKITQIQNFTKLRPMESELFHADGRTDMTKLTVAFRNVANAPKTLHHKPQKGIILQSVPQSYKWLPSVSFSD